MPLAMTMTLRRTEDAHRSIPWADLRLAVVRALAHRCGIPERELEARPRPYSLSPFQGDEPSRRAAATHGTDRARIGWPAERFRLRVSWLDDTHLEPLLRRAPVTPDDPLRLPLDPCPVRIEAASIRPSPWDAWSRWDHYGRLFSSASDTLRTATLRFCSPTVLLRQGAPYPLPDPNVIFGQYLDLWNRFSGIPLDRGLALSLDQDLVLADFRLRARPAGSGPTSTPSFSGSATFRLRGRRPETLLKGFNALADFSFYCGTGAQTEQGMGLTRRILPGTRTPEERTEPRAGCPGRHRAGREVR